MLTTRYAGQVRLVRDHDALFALMGSLGWLARVRPDLRCDSLFYFDGPRSHTAWGMDVLPEDSTVWAAYNLLGSDAHGAPTEYIYLSRWLLRGRLEAVTMVDSFPCHESSGMSIQLSRCDGRLRILAATNAVRDPASPRARTGPFDPLHSMVVYDQRPDGTWQATGVGPGLIGSPRALSVGEPGAQTRATAQDERGLYQLLIPADAGAARSQLMESNSMLVFRPADLGQRQMVDGGSTGVSILAWMGKQKSGGGGRPRVPGFLEPVIEQPYDVFVACGRADRLEPATTVSASDALHWSTRESSGYLAVAPGPGGAIVLATTYSLGPGIGLFHLRAFRVRVDGARR